MTLITALMPMTDVAKTCAKQQKVSRAERSCIPFCEKSLCERNHVGRAEFDRV